MRILKIEYKNVGLFEDGFIIDFIARDKVTDKNFVFNYENTFYTQNTIAVIGANASGKTSALQLINMAFNIVLDQQPLEKLLIPKGLVKDNTEMIVDFYDEPTKNYYRISSVFEYLNNEDSELLNLKFSDEALYRKSASSVKNKRLTTDFQKSELISTRSQLREKVTFLRDDDSILFYLLSKNKKSAKKTSIALIDENMMNYYRVAGEATIEDINIFDSSIDKLTSEKSQISVKFKNKSGELTCSREPNQNYLLSSGTAKGGNVLFWLKTVIRNGGYLIIDELENHFHKRLVQFVIDLFNDETINKKGATLIFTTHYAEILDFIDRKDNIFVLIRDEEFKTLVIRYSDAVKRIENKKSEIILSNYIKGTSPSYKAIQLFKESIWK